MTIQYSVTITVINVDDSCEFQISKTRNITSAAPQLDMTHGKLGWGSDRSCNPIFAMNGTSERQKK